MKRHATASLLVLVLGTLSWGSAQAVRTDLFDARKSEQELAIMKGILSTTLEFVAQEVQSETGKAAAKGRPMAVGRWLRTSVEGFYLYGQGATFVVPLSGLRFGLSKFKLIGSLDEIEALKVEPELALHSMEQAEAALEAANGQVAERTAELQDMVRAQEEYRAAGVARAVVAQPPAPAQSPAPPAPPRAAPAPAPPAAPPAPHRDDETVRRKIFEAQEQVKKRREEAEQTRQKFMEAIARIKAHLIEALANHGDSLTQVRPNEYINIVITTNGGDPVLFDSTAGGMDNDVISVQKSVITDYKAGRLTLDAFKQKVLNYRS